MANENVTLALSKFRDLFAPKRTPEALCNQRVKLYPDPVPGKWYIGQILTYDRPFFNPGKQWEIRVDEVLPEEEETAEDPEEDPRQARGSTRAYKRARANCFDLMMCNPDMDTFCTFTVSPEQADRTSYDEIVKKLSVWLSNRVQRRGMKYILIPEYHKDGESIHFHGFVNFDALKLVDSGKRRHGRKIYNVSDLPLGFSTAVRISGADATEKVSKYIWKYITKNGGQRIGGRYFLHGGEMITPRLEYNTVSFMEAPGELITPFDGACCKVVSLTEEKIFQSARSENS